ncbi:hypothetical protein YC2023_075631 [Brassica napus]
MQNPFTSHLMRLAIWVGSTPANRSLLLLKSWSQQTRRNLSSHELARRAFFSTLTDSKPTVSCSATVSSKPNSLDDYLTVIAVPLQDGPLIPGFFKPLYVTNPKVLAALQESKSGETPYAGAFLLTDDKDTSTGSPVIHRVGTLAQIISIQGEQFIVVGLRGLSFIQVGKDPLTVKTHHLKDKPYDKDDEVIIKATYFEVISMITDVVKTTELWRHHAFDFNYQKLADFGAGISDANKHKIQEVLEELDVVHKLLDLTLQLVKKQVEINKIKKFHASAFPLINSVLFSADTFRKRIEPIIEKIPKHVLKVIFAMKTEIRTLLMTLMTYISYNIYSYLDWLTTLPWGKCSDENFDVLRAEAILDEDHYGLADIKERILEFIAVRTLTGNPEVKIICLSGPPGVGKTSIARSIARVLDRKFFRLAVGGLSDSSEIKGDRGVCVGAKPGKMVQCLKQVGTENPLVLLDEIDKIGKSSKYDPEGALLELLDPEQNAQFLDYFLDVPIDLSKILFVCTANDIDRLPDPLLDRMEVIKLAGYTTDEKMHIARDYLVKIVSGKCGIKPDQVDVSDTALLSLIENYCREAGVRNLQKHIENIFRKVPIELMRKGRMGFNPKWKQEARRKGETSSGSIELKNEYLRLADVLKVFEHAVDGGSTRVESREVAEKFTVDESNLSDYVGKQVFEGEKLYEQTPVGVVMGLSWTSMGGSTFYNETTFV